MYLNEKAWDVLQEDRYLIDRALKNFLDIYAAVKRKHPRNEIYVPVDEELYFRTTRYTIGQWLSSADKEYKRLYLLFCQKQIRYYPEDEYEFVYDGMPLKGGTEAYLNDSFLISIGFDKQWEKESFQGSLYSLENDEETFAVVNNVFSRTQLETDEIKKILEEEDDIKVYSYEELWERREEFFPHLSFCPSVRENLVVLERFYLSQVIKKLMELERYCINHTDEKFNASFLTKTTMESEGTIQKYRERHTFLDECGDAYIASWHMRFTGIPGRIFFIPAENYREDKILVCYIGKKLPNVSYPT